MADADDLLAELQTPMPPMAPGETAPTHDLPRAALLTVAPPQRPTAIAKADSLHSTAVGGQGFRVKLRGEYMALRADGKGVVAKPFELEVNLPRLEGALSAIKNNLLKPLLKRKYPDFARPRGVGKIVDTQPLSPDTPRSRDLQYMDAAGLIEHIQAIKAPIDPKAYPDVTDLRDAIIDYVLTPSGFEAREAERQRKRLEAAEFHAMNPGLEG